MLQRWRVLLAIILCQASAIKEVYQCGKFSGQIGVQKTLMQHIPL